MWRDRQARMRPKRKASMSTAPAPGPAGSGIIDTGGRLQLPTAPGLGVRLDESVLDRYWLAPGPVPDGSYSDMLFGPAPAPATPYAAAWPHARPAEGAPG